MDFTMETLDERKFDFFIRKMDQEIIPIQMNLSTSLLSVNVTCNGNTNDFICKTSTSAIVAFLTSLNDRSVTLYTGYRHAGIQFSKDVTKYLLKISSQFTPVNDKNLCIFLMEWPSTVTLQEPQEQVTEAVIPLNFESCEDSENCDFLKGENGVKFGSKDTVEFTMANLDKEKEFKLLHTFGYFSPIFTLNDSVSCSKYSTKITFNDLGFIVFKRDGEKIGIESNSLTHENLPILKESNVQFYFFDNFIYCTFFDPQNHFQLHTFGLSDGNGENVLSIKIDYKSSVKSCNGIVKLIVVRKWCKIIVSKKYYIIYNF
uniref:Uncharacterized protein n=1 Tax=Panagrolaimus davidi TaxID=227884 RepID=A0A914QT36_9BILA